MKNKSTLTIRVPEELKDKIETLSAQQGISINQFALYVFTKEIGQLENARFFREMTRGIDKKKLFSRIDEIIAHVPERDDPSWDRIREIKSAK